MMVRFANLSLSSLFPLSLSLLSHSHSIPFLSPSRFSGKAVLRKWCLLVSGQKGELVCFTFPSSLNFFLSLSLFHRGANDKGDKRHAGMLVSDKEARVAGGHAQ